MLGVIYYGALNLETQVLTPKINPSFFIFESTKIHILRTSKFEKPKQNNVLIGVPNIFENSNKCYLLTSLLHDHLSSEQVFCDCIKQANEYRSPRIQYENEL